ncbi:MAG TPA: hypothetical protein VF631_03260 [Allosphingosinicella sp.]
MTHSASLLGLAIAASLTTACAFSPQLQRVAVDHDQMVAKTEDELTLRNILRARYRYPLHFTTITEVNGDAQISLGASLGAGLPGTSVSRSFNGSGALTGSGQNDGAATVSPNLNGSVTTRPSFRAAVLATEKFQRGLQQPLKGELIAYYLDAGWPDELLMSLFVERLDLIEKQTGRRLASVYNDADDAYGFQSVICNFVIKSHRIEDRFELARARDVFEPADLQALDQSKRPAAVQKFVDLLKDEQVDFDNEKLSFKTNSSYSVTFSRGRDRCAGADFSRTKADWKSTHPTIGLAEGEIRNGIPVLTGGALLDPGRFALIDPSPGSPRGLDARFLEQVPNPSSGAGTPGWRDVSLEVHFRSVQDVIYFLGEYVRAGPAAYQIPRENFLVQCGASVNQPLRQMRWILLVREGDAKHGVSTRFLGKRFSLPAETDEGDGPCGSAGGESSRSLQVISLVQQLLNLNKSADQLPRSISITAIP